MDRRSRSRASTRDASTGPSHNIDTSEPPFHHPSRPSIQFSLTDRDQRDIRNSQPDLYRNASRTTANSRATGSDTSRRPRRRTLYRAISTATRPAFAPSILPAEEDYSLGTYAPYVNPAYEELNPEYQQPANAKPVWSFAKPLPRVVRPGMVPAAAEVGVGERKEGRLGVDVGIEDLEKGRQAEQRENLSRISSQVKDARTQRESNIVNGTSGVGRKSVSSIWTGKSYNYRIPSAVGRRRRATGVSMPEPLSPTFEGEEGEEDEYGFPRGSIDSDIASSAISDYPTYHQMLREHSRIVGFGEPMNSEDIDEAPLPWAELDPVKIAENPPLIEEQFNHHTTWSVIRSRHREFLAEFLAVFVQMTIGLCANAQATIKYNQVASVTTSWAWGFAVIIGIHLAGGVSGAHLNPALTFMLWIFRGFPKRMVPRYILAQFLGAFLATFLTYGIYHNSIKQYLLDPDARSNVENIFITSRRYDFVDSGSAFLNEFVGTTLLSCTLLALGDDQNVPPGVGMNPLIIALISVGFNFSLTFQTGLALNPTRDFGPRLAIFALGYGDGLWRDGYWFYGPILGPVAGALLGACVYDVFVFTGGESPVNYPWERTRRTWEREKGKWRGRMRWRRKGREMEEKGGRSG